MVFVQSKGNTMKLTDIRNSLNEISAIGGLKQVVKGNTKEVEGIKLSKEMAQAMIDWFNSSPYGRKYPKAAKARLHLSLGIMMSFGLDRYAKFKGAKEELKHIKDLSKAMRDNVNEESVNEVNYDDSLADFNKELEKTSEVKKAAKHYNKSTKEVVKALQTRIKVNRYSDKSIKQISINYTEDGPLSSKVTIKLSKNYKQNESVNEAKSMDTSKRLKVYDKLKKGDEITIKYGSSMSSGREGKFKVTKGKTLVGKQKVERIILQNVSNPKGVKYFLYQRNGNVTMAIGNMAATIEDMHEGINEMDLNDPIMVKLRAAQIKKNKDAAKKIEKQKKINPDYKALKNAPKIKALKNKRAEIMRDMEQEAEPEGGKIADRYGRELNKIDNAIIKLGGNPMSESINEAKEPEVITTLRKIVKNKQNDLIKDTKSGKKVRVDMNSANLMVQVYDALKQSNKDKFVKSGIVMMGHTAYKLMKKENTSEVIEEAEYQGRKVELNKPMQGDSKKFKVYVKNAKGNVVVVHFGQKGMNIKKNNPKARKSFRARMNCDNPGPKWKANYWSCRKW